MLVMLLVQGCLNYSVIGSMSRACWLCTKEGTCLIKQSGDTYDDFASSKPDNECHYVVFDLDFTDKR
jgi:hypothetical protein